MTPTKSTTRLRTYKSVFEDDTYYEQWVEMWKYLAEELKDFKGVAGYGLINQPRARVKVKVESGYSGNA